MERRENFLSEILMDYGRVVFGPVIAFVGGPWAPVDAEPVLALLGLVSSGISCPWILLPLVGFCCWRYHVLWCCPFGLGWAVGDGPFLQAGGVEALRVLH